MKGARGESRDKGTSVDALTMSLRLEPEGDASAQRRFGDEIPRATKLKESGRAHFLHVDEED